MVRFLIVGFTLVESKVLRLQNAPLRSIKNDCLKADGNGSNHMNIFKKLVSIAITAVMMNRNKCLTLY